MQEEPYPASCAQVLTKLGGSQHRLLSASSEATLLEYLEHIDLHSVNNKVPSYQILTLHLSEELSVQWFLSKAQLRLFDVQGEKFKYVGFKYFSNKKSSVK